MFWGVAILHDVQMLEYYRNTIPWAHDLHMGEFPTQPATILPGECIHSERAFKE
jgi:hypothetical protein